MSDYQNVAQGLTPMVGQQLGFPAGGMNVPQHALPAPQAPVAQTPSGPQAPFVVPPAPGAPAPAAPAAPVVPPHPEPAPNPPHPPMDQEALQRLRDNVDQVLDQACDDLTDENREQEWTERAFEILPKWYLNRFVGFANVVPPRFDLIVAMIRQSCSVDRFARLDALVQNPAKYQLFMQGLIHIVNEHREHESGPPAPVVPPLVIPEVPTSAPLSAPPPDGIIVPPAPVDATGKSPVSPPAPPVDIPAAPGTPPPQKE
jgi:hypothetical protein